MIARKPSIRAFWRCRSPGGIRDRDHIRLVTARPCIVCGRLPSDPHHLRFAQSRALSRKVSDEFTVPLCRGHHRELHRHGDEAAWWSRHGIDLLGVARTPCAPWEVLEFASAPCHTIDRVGERWSNYITLQKPQTPRLKSNDASPVFRPEGRRHTLMMRVSTTTVVRAPRLRSAAKMLLGPVNKPIGTKQNARSSVWCDCNAADRRSSNTRLTRIGVEVRARIRERRGRPIVW